jgi:hypothetical protein
MSGVISEGGERLGLFLAVPTSKLDGSPILISSGEQASATGRPKATPRITHIAAPMSRRPSSWTYTSSGRPIIRNCVWRTLQDVRIINDAGKLSIDLRGATTVVNSSRSLQDDRMAAKRNGKAWQV